MPGSRRPGRGPTNELMTSRTNGPAERDRAGPWQPPGCCYTGAGARRRAFQAP